MNLQLPMVEHSDVNLSCLKSFEHAGDDDELSEHGYIVYSVKVLCPQTPLQYKDAINRARDYTFAEENPFRPWAAIALRNGG